MSGSGEIGRRTALRWLRPQGHGSSSLPFRTTSAFNKVSCAFFISSCIFSCGTGVSRISGTSGRIICATSRNDWMVAYESESCLLRELTSLTCICWSLSRWHLRIQCASVIVGSTCQACQYQNRISFPVIDRRSRPIPTLCGQQVFACPYSRYKAETPAPSRARNRILHRDGQSVATFAKEEPVSFARLSAPLRHS